MAAPQPKLTPASLAKQAGNDAYKAGDYALAVAHYTTALHASSPQNVDTAWSSALAPRARNEPQEIYLINRALAYIKLEQWDAAIDDCTEALVLNPHLSKAYYRRAVARKSAGGPTKLEGARKDITEYGRLAIAHGAAKEGVEKAVGAMLKEIKDLIASGGNGDDPPEPPPGTPRPSYCPPARSTAASSFSPPPRNPASATTSRPTPPRAPPAGSPRAPTPAHTTLSATPTAEARPGAFSRMASPFAALSSAFASPASAPIAAAASTRQEKDHATLLDSVQNYQSVLEACWRGNRREMITVWKDMAILDVRRSLVKGCIQGLKKDVPVPHELKVPGLIDGDNLLDFISSRATRDNSNMAFHHDLAAAQLSLALKTGTGTGPRNRTLSSSPRYMLITEAAYGTIITMDLKNDEQVETRRKAIQKGEACEWNEGKELLNRQWSCLHVAVAISKKLAQMGEDEEVNVGHVEEYEQGVKNPAYSGREEYSIARVEAIVKSSRAYAEDHVDFLREDADYVVEHILDRLPRTASMQQKDLVEMLGREETMEMFLNGFARQTLWKEVLNVIDILKDKYPDLGAGQVLPQAYQRKIALLAKLVEAFINLTFRELTASVEKTFQSEFAVMEGYGGGGFDGFYAFLDMLARVEGLPLPPSLSNRTVAATPLASLFRALIKLDPQTMPNQTWEIAACLNQLKELFDRKPEEKTRLSRRLVEGLGEYTEAIELREMLLDSHRPRFSRDYCDRSQFLSQLGPLWQQLERCWTKSVNSTHIARVVRMKNFDSLNTIWKRFEDEVVKQLKAKPEVLFDRLLSEQVKPHGSQLLYRTVYSMNFSPDGNPSFNSHNEYHDEEEEDEVDEDSDAPPALVDGSDDDTDSDASAIGNQYDEEDSDEYSEEEEDSDEYSEEEDEEDSEYDGMPGLEDQDSDVGAVPTRARVPPPPVRAARPAPRPRVPRPTQQEPAPGPSHSTRAPPVNRPPPDLSGVRPDHEFGAPDGVRPPSPVRVHRDKKVKKKTRATTEAIDPNATTTTEGETTEGETEMVEGHVFEVSERVYNTFEQYLGVGPTISRTDVAWTEFIHAMKAVGFTAIKTSGSSWKFHPIGRLLGNQSISFHEPHPDASQRPHQVAWTGKRLQRNYGLSMDNFKLRSAVL